MSAVLLGVFVLFYNRIFALTFDPTFMQATGGRARAYNLLFAVLCAVVISLSMRLVGSLLISALIIFPAITAMSVYRSFRSVMICSAAVGVGCALVGMILSILFGTPSGASIVACDIVAFGIFRLVALCKK